MAFNFIFRLIIWLLLTADLSWFNILIGIIVVVIIPRTDPPAARVIEWLQVLWHLIIAIPQAYIEAIEMMIYPHTEEEIILEHYYENSRSIDEISKVTDSNITEILDVYQTSLFKLITKILDGNMHTDKRMKKPVSEERYDF
jgi:multicomponent Na+:H+ antiporter subunit E